MTESDPVPNESLPNTPLDPHVASRQNTDSPKAESHLNSEDLFQSRNEVLIQHGEEVYRLRLTKSGKLILHK